MKSILFGLLLAFPITLFAQNKDSLKIAQEIDSLVWLNGILVEEKKWGEAMHIIDEAEQMTTDVFGTANLLYAKVIFNQGRTFHIAGKHTDAMQNYIQAKAIFEQLSAMEVPDYASTLNNLATLYKNMRQFEKAESLYLESKDIRAKIFGTEHQTYAASLYNLGGLYKTTGQYDKAESLYIESKDIRAKVFGKYHRDYLHTINNLAGLYKNLGKFVKAELLYLESKDIRAKVFGTEHKEYATSLFNLGGLYKTTGQYNKAESLILEGKDIFVKALGKNNATYATILRSLGSLYEEIWQFEKAKPLYLESKRILEKVLGKEHHEYGKSIANLGNIYFKLGDYKKAEPLFLENKDIMRISLGKEHPYYATAIANLGALYFELGQYSKTIELLLESKNIRKEKLGEEHPHYALSLVNLAIFYKKIKEYKKAESMYLEAKTIWEKVLGKEHPEYAVCLNNLASLYRTIEKYDKAEQLYIEAKDIRKKVLGEEHPDYAESLINLGSFYMELELFANADSILNKGIAIREKVMGNDHPFYIEAVFILSSLNEILERYSDTEQNLTEVAIHHYSRLKEAASYLSEKELTYYDNLLQSNGEKMLNFAFERKNSKIALGQLPGLSYDNALFYKGFLLNSSLKAKQLISKSPQAKNLNNELKSYRRRLNQQYIKTIRQRDSALITELEEKANTTEKKLVREIVGYAEATQQVNWKDVKSALKKGEAAIEFAQFNVKFPEETDSVMYAALVLLPDSQQPRFVPLFEENEIKKFFQIEENSGDAYSEKINTIYDADWGRYKNLYDLIWRPLDSLLEGVDQIYYAPTGLLHKVAFAALPIAENRRLMDNYDLQLVTSTRDIIFKSKSESLSISSVALFGDVDYKNKNNVDDTELLADITDNRSILKCELLKNGNTIPSLPGSEMEIQFLQKLFEENNIDSIQINKRKKADETALKRLGLEIPSPSILHLSTHGFFFELTDVNDLNCADSIDSSWEAIITSENPLLRSGLLMSGAEQSIQSENDSDGDDGILTALEIANVDLSNTQLAVLSACETGLGDISGNEGVYGLQRAFKMAGVDYILMTLWKVHDETTNEFMQIFYKHLLKNTHPNEALQLAQNEIRKKKPHPFYWAGFVLL